MAEETKKAGASRVGEPTIVDQSTFEIKGKDSGTVYGQGENLGQALALQNQITGGSTPTVAGRPDLFAVAPTSADDVKPFVDQETGQIIQPKVATPEQLMQRAGGTLESFNQVRGIETAKPTITDPVVPTKPTDYADALRQVTQLGAEDAKSTLLGAPKDYDSQILQQKAALMAKLFGQDLTPDELKWLTPAQSAAITSNDKKLIQAQLAGLNTITQGRKEMKKEEEDRALRQFEIFAASGMAPDQVPADFLAGLDASIGLPEGTFKSYYTAQYATTQAERESALLDSAIKLNQYLNTVPAGQAVKVGDNTYVGTDVGQIEINGVTGDVYSMQVDPDTGAITIRNFGNVGPQTNRQVIQRFSPETGNYEYWSVDPNNPLDAKPITYGGEGGAATGGVNTYSLMDAYPQGQGFSDTSWCVEWIRNIAEDGSLPDVGEMNTIEAKAAWTDASIGYGDGAMRVPRAGDYILTNEDATWGHIGLITEVKTTPDGRTVAVLSESNYTKGKVTHNRTIELSEANLAANGGSILGFHQANLRAEYTSQSPLIAEPGVSGGNIANLSPELQLQARALSTKIFGKKAGADPDNIGLISSLVSSGMSIDQIEDSLRYSGQSAEMSGMWRDAGEAVAGQLSSVQGEQFMNTLDRQLEDGNVTGAVETVRRGVYQALDTESAKKLGGSERGLELFREIRGDLAAYEAAGGNTGIFTGTNEDVLRAIGKTSDPKLAELANKIQISIQRYRQAVSGAAFTESEAKEYKKVFPSVSNTGELNSALLNSATQVFQGDADFYYGRVLGDTTAKTIFDSATHNVAANLIGRRTADGTVLADADAWSIAFESAELMRSGATQNEILARINKLLGY